MYCVLSYDVSDDRRRAKISKLMEGHGIRVQKSVFECILEPDRLRRLVERTCRLLDESSDSLRLYVICEGCKGKVEVYGCAEVLETGALVV